MLTKVSSNNAVQRAANSSISLLMEDRNADAVLRSTSSSILAKDDTSTDAVLSSSSLLREDGCSEAVLRAVLEDTCNEAVLRTASSSSSSLLREDGSADAGLRAVGNSLIAEVRSVPVDSSNEAVLKTANSLLYRENSQEAMITSAGSFVIELNGTVVAGNTKVVPVEKISSVSSKNQKSSRSSLSLLRSDEGFWTDSDEEEDRKVCKQVLLPAVLWIRIRI